MPPKNLSLLLILSSLVSFSPLNAMQRYKQHAHVVTDAQRRRVILGAHATQLKFAKKSTEMLPDIIIIAEPEVVAGLGGLLIRGAAAVVGIVYETGWVFRTKEQKKLIRNSYAALRMIYYEDGTIGDIATNPKVPDFIKNKLNSREVKYVIEYIKKVIPDAFVVKNQKVTAYTYDSTTGIVTGVVNIMPKDDSSAPSAASQASARPSAPAAAPAGSAGSGIGLEELADAQQVMVAIYQPYGLYQESSRKIPGKIPRDGQTALDAAIWCSQSGKLWGVEDDKLIWFQKLAGSTTYEGHFVPSNSRQNILERAKNKHREVQAHKAALRAAAAAGGGAPKDPREKKDENEDEDNPDTLEYEQNPKHHANSVSPISPDPLQPAESLKRSIKISSKERVALCKSGEWVDIFKLTIIRGGKRIFHGYRVPIHQLKQMADIRNALQKAGLISATGKILKK